MELVKLCVCQRSMVAAPEVLLSPSSVLPAQKSMQLWNPCCVKIRAQAGQTTCLYLGHNLLIQGWLNYSRTTDLLKSCWLSQEWLAYLTVTDRPTQEGLAYSMTTDLLNSVWSTQKTGLLRSDWPTQEWLGQWLITVFEFHSQVQKCLFELGWKGKAFIPKQHRETPIKKATDQVYYQRM